MWVVHHDALTGRETGTVDNKRRKIESLRYEKEWGYLRSRDQHSGQLLDIVPPNFRQVARAFALNAKPGQLLNIEIKTHASQRDLEMLDFLAFKYIGKGRYFYSSLTLSNLERMRAINPDEFLSFIQSPAKRSLEILRNDLEKGVASDPIFLRNKDMLEDIAGFAIRRYKEHRYDDSRGMAKLKTALKHNYGLAIDIRQYAQRALSIKTQASRDGITVATYTINGHEYQAQSLLTMNASSRPTSVIIDDTLYGFCSQYDLPKMKSYSGSTALTKRMAALPEDLDLERLSELNTYYGNGLYPAINGQLKSITGKATSHNYKPVILKTQAGPKEARTTVELESKKVIKIELRKESND